jgi:phospholipid/cholesterol/gamma-HCH transport system permease protein
MAKPSATWHYPAPSTAVLVLAGHWNGLHASEQEKLLDGLSQPNAPALSVEISCRDITALDTFGALLISKIQKKLDIPALSGLEPSQSRLLAEIAALPVAAPRAEPDPGLYGLLSDIGETVIRAGRDLSDGVTFFGAVIATFGKIATGRARFRKAAVMTQLERVALRGVPIIVLMSFLVGAIIAQQSIFQLQAFGTVHYVADLIGILVLRELAVLLTAIMVAGRSGSSFTAELGSMKMREEVDALETMGLDPMEVLVLPRILALMIGLPLLTFLAGMSGIAGGAVVANIYGGVSPDVFFGRLQNAIGLNTFLVGMIKAPFMALVIGMIACIEGFAVRGSAESLGRHTTASVVKAIFIVIVIDGLFAMFFAAIDY